MAEQETNKRTMTQEEPVEETQNTQESEAAEEFFEDQASGIDESIHEELEQAKKELEECEERYLRLQAELQNTLRRNQKEKEEAARYRSQSLATELLPVIDNLERALTIEVTDEQGKSLKKGIEMVLASFEQALSKEGIETLDPVGEPFDPQFHEAYTAVPAEEGQESGTVAQVFEKGYTLHGRVLRAAKVAVVQ
ncbi:nucleotide exchange factor GrpE [Atopococcus tabaci]|uniref:nucleotide exchange factor GrpE n=1 Tax=Atopococcus tabaci TaxID=269774 RepID=UPI001F0B60D0|nr:nucleotide exchange factor GrpE [Atopococcus tabaci]